MGFEICTNERVTLSEFEPDHLALEAPKNICCAKGKGAVDLRWFQKFCSSCRKHDQVMSGRPKTVNSEGQVPSHRDKFNE